MRVTKIFVTMLLTHTKDLVVGEVDMHGSPTAWGRTFKGDYANSSAYIIEVISELWTFGITAVPGRTLAIFYDDPSKKDADQLTSFQGVFVEETTRKAESPLLQFSFKGRYLYVKNSGGEVMKMIFEGYDRLFDYIRTHNTRLKSPSGYQVLTNTNDGIIAEILMELE